MCRIATSRSPKETESLGQRIGQRCTGGEILALIGDLGAGKTRFVKGLASGIGADPDRVTSPTFVIHQRYSGPQLGLEHVDAYRLAGAEDWHRLGLEDWCGPQAVLVVEWADRIAGALPPDRLEIRFKIQDQDTRRLRFDARGAAHTRLLDALPTA